MRKRLSCSVVMLLGACDFAPDYQLPAISTPSTFQEDSGEALADVAPATDGKWKRFDETAHIDEFAWWRMFNDPSLDAIMDQAMQDNPTLAVAIERVNAARAVADTTFAALLPAAGVGFGPERQLQSPEAIKASMPSIGAVTTKPYTLYTARGSISYDLDIFGQNRSRLRAATDDAEAEQSNYRAARLSLQAEVAQTYYRIAGLRAEDAVLKNTIAARSNSLKLIAQKYDVGSVDALVLANAQAELANAQGEGEAVAQSLAVAEHAMAALLGKTPTELTLKTADLAAMPPRVPAGLPSALLERRPDIKQAEKRIAAANERIGVARAGYFPDISLSASGGFVSGGLSDLFQWSNRTWAIGPLAGTMLTQPLFEGGKIAAARAQSQADFQGAVAEYRAAVLTAFREVEDQLSGVRHVNAQAQAASDALNAASRAYHVANERFNVGYSSQLEFLDAERQVLAAKRSNAQLRAQQYIVTVQLVRALGGSWETPVAAPKTDAAPAAE